MHRVIGHPYLAFYLRGKEGVCDLRKVICPPRGGADPSPKNVPQSLGQLPPGRSLTEPRDGVILTFDAPGRSWEHTIWEMSAEWAESGKEELPEIVFRNVRCMDPGIEDGGVGGVVYRIYTEKIVS